jgi:hypothetical protein
LQVGLAHCIATGLLLLAASPRRIAWASRSRSSAMAASKLRKRASSALIIRTPPASPLRAIHAANQAGRPAADHHPTHPAMLPTIAPAGRVTPGGIPPSNVSLPRQVPEEAKIFSAPCGGSYCSNESLALTPPARRAHRRAVPCRVDCGGPEWRGSGPFATRPARPSANASGRTPVALLAWFCSACNVSARACSRLVDRFGSHYTPKHGSRLNMAEPELGVLSDQCLDRRIPDQQTLTEEVAALEDRRNKKRVKADWQFTAADARVKLNRLYPAM